MRADDGHELYYQVHGQGEPLVLVHGSLCDYRYWQWQLQALSRDYQVIVPSLRHYYPERWDGQGNDFHTERHVADLCQLLAALGQPAHLLGHSRGGNLALRVALQAPHSVRSLILADPGGEFAPSVFHAAGLPAVEPGPRRNQFREQALALIREGEREAGLRLFVDTVSGEGVWSRSSKMFREMAHDNAMTLIGQVVDHPEPISLAPLLGLQVPVLLVGGALSPQPFPSIARALHAVLARSELAWIDGASHGMNAQRPAGFNRQVLDFLQRQAG